MPQFVVRVTLSVYEYRSLLVGGIAKIPRTFQWNRLPAMAPAITAANTDRKRAALPSNSNFSCLSL